MELRDCIHSVLYSTIILIVLIILDRFKLTIRKHKINSRKLNEILAKDKLRCRKKLPFLKGVFKRLPWKNTKTALNAKSQALSTVSIVHTCTEGKRLHGLSTLCALAGSWPQGQARLNTLRKCCVTSRVSRQRLMHAWVLMAGWMLHSWFGHILYNLHMSKYEEFKIFVCNGGNLIKCNFLLFQYWMMSVWGNKKMWKVQEYLHGCTETTRERDTL